MTQVTAEPVEPVGLDAGDQERIFLQISALRSVRFSLNTIQPLN